MVGESDPVWAVSIKGVICWDGRTVVLRNERDEWELPGGRLQHDDPGPRTALRREMREELRLDVEVGGLVDSWIYDVDDHRVLILTYACSAPRPKKLRHSDEHIGVAEMTVDELCESPMPGGYLRGIRRALATLASA